jgi:hypothetical protein
MSSSKRKDNQVKKGNNPLNLTDKIIMNAKIEKEFATHNSDQRKEIKKLSEIFKNIIEESTNADLKRTCEEGLEMVRAFVKNNKDNPCQNEQEMSERLRGLYQNVQKFVNEELSVFDDPELEEVEDIMSTWNEIIVTVQNIQSSRHTPYHFEEKQKIDKYLEPRTYEQSQMTISLLLQHLKQI